MKVMNRDKERSLKLRDEKKKEYEKSMPGGDQKRRENTFCVVLILLLEIVINTMTGWSVLWHTGPAFDVSFF